MAERAVIVLGAGGHAKVVIDLLRKLGRTVVAAVEPTAPAEGAQVLGVPMENESVIEHHAPGDIELALGIGMPSQDPIAGLAARRKIAERFAVRGYRFPPLVHPSAIVGNDCTIGAGAQIMAGAIVQPSCRIGAFAIVNTGACVDHDCELGENCHVAPGATLGGGIRVGAETLIGIGASVHQNLVIGARALIGGGAMVAGPVGDGEVRIGVPARGIS
jgi:sugar O-acyltransferase (sialic acid O-acetyltransferase NeuD family)